MGFIVTRSLGISLRNGEAFFVLLSKLAGRIRLVESGSFPLPEAPAAPAAGTESVQTPGALPEKLSRHLLHRRPDAVVLGLPRREAILRPVELPSLDDKDLAGLLAYEIERHLPFPAEEACYHYQRMKQTGEKATVMLAAIRRGDVERHLEALGRVGLQPTAVEISALAALNALLYQQRHTKSELLCLVALDAQQAEVSAVQGQELLFSRALATTEDPFEPLHRELGRALEESGKLRTTLFVSGGSADLRVRLAQALGVKVEPWSPADPSADAAAFGLALQGLTRLPLRLDLLPSERKPKPRDRALAAMFALLALLALLGAGWGAGDAYLERRKLDHLTERVAEVKAHAEAAARLKAEDARLRTQVLLFETLARDRTRGLATIKEMVAILPVSVYLTEFSLEGMKLQIRGTTGGSASELIAAFERSSYFENAAFISPISAQGSDKQGFQLQATVKGR
jgi:Tfp pilus assembly protein PilN